MRSCEFHVGSIRQHRDGVRAPRILVENGALMMMGRSIPVVSPEQLEERLLKIGCNEEVVNEIVGNLFGFPLRSEVLLRKRVATETAVTFSEVVEDFV